MTNGFNPNQGMGMMGGGPEEDAMRRFMEMLRSVGYGAGIAALLNAGSKLKGKKGLGSEDNFLGGGGTGFEDSLPGWHPGTGSAIAPAP